jgi:taurine dioxygenase
MKIEAITSRIGARVRGIDLSRPIDAAAVIAIRAALDEHAVLFFVDQPRLSAEEQVGFARAFGEIEITPFQTPGSPVPEVMVLDQNAPKGQGADHWHADSTFRKSADGGDPAGACPAGDGRRYLLLEHVRRL